MDLGFLENPPSKEVLQSEVEKAFAEANMMGKELFWLKPPDKEWMI